MSFNVTNQRSAPASRGQSVIITLNASDSVQLDNMEIGQKCTVLSSTGYISSIDTYGHQFKVKPDKPSNSFIEIANLAYMPSGATITVDA
jgi:hypothetical protein